VRDQRQPPVERPGGPGHRGSGRDAFERAVGALGHRERTTAELSTWLAERGFAPEEVEGAIARLIEIGELDDERFARRYAEDKRSLRGWGAERIREALFSKGLERSLVEAALSEASEQELERAVELLERRAGPLGRDAERARALAYLARRGYDSETAYEAIRRSARRAA
jgi:regulatory protein